MASARASSSNSKDWQKQVLCRFFANGMCRAGDNCPYGHDKNLSNKRTIACKFFATGTCAFGDKCRFSHGDDDSSSETVATSMSQLSLNPNASSWAPPTLKSTQQNSKATTSQWTDAAEFVPLTKQKQQNQQKKTDKSDENSDTPSDSKESEEEKSSKSWAQVVNAHAMAELTIEEAESQLCPFSLMDECRYGENCAYVHGYICDMCNQPILHPTHEGQRKTHEKKCMKQHEAEMEQAFAVAKSKEKTCGICMEVVIDKMPKTEARFGIMPNCNHCFCLSCLRKWRQAKSFENKIIRACPECRQTSDYICPSKYWMDTPEEKEKLFEQYRANLLQKECKYFNKGAGECPFGNKCFYRHANKDGKDVDVGPPQKHLRHNANGDPSLVERILLYDFLEERDGNLLLPLEIFDVLDFLSDSDDSEWSGINQFPT